MVSPPTAENPCLPAHSPLFRSPTRLLSIGHVRRSELTDANFVPIGPTRHPAFRSFCSCSTRAWATNAYIRDRLMPTTRATSWLVRSELSSKSIRSTVAGVGLDHSVVGDLMAGRSWPDAHTVALLEVALDVSLSSSA